MEIVVFGAGSLGSLVGGLLAQPGAHEVTLVARDPHASAVRTAGLQLAGEFSETVAPAAVTDGTELAAELGVVTVKSFDTEAAAAALATGSFDAVLSLQNGMGNEATLAGRLDVPVLAGTATYGALLREPGVVECTGLGEVTLGPRSGGSTPLADRVGEAFALSPLETTVASDMPTRLWRKLAVNAGINPLTALTGTKNEAVLADPATELARTAARETARVARADGVSLSDETAVKTMTRVARQTALNSSSMAQDVRAGRRTEIDAINGYVVERADELGVSVPANRTLTALLRTWEHDCGFR
ncbi:ketopantoate reductase family protein [Natrialba asiatica]|uniref:2-dehydropantoate 2-reductase n=1 Tax=Natrialba asiatica (strain ATCC 700177 / DSM 12278 / JCM 9576 / FERM P-10747 / NBRC 102637 / 172P1) TaxID=29540 RepID=M0AL05_NATA1|nr:2-dehydropantoate 2-reductase [Natrialba asiatica]ELY98043.1 2-dehydropantoate 2-reductase [Natrialba asiatica DSM 12278]